MLIPYLTTWYWLNEKVQLRQQDLKVNLYERQQKRQKGKPKESERNQFWCQYICFRLNSCYLSCWAGAGINKLALDLAQTPISGLCIALTQTHRQKNKVSTVTETLPGAGWLWLCVLRGTARQHSQAFKRGQLAGVSWSRAAWTAGASLWVQSKDQSLNTSEINTLAWRELNIAIRLRLVHTTDTTGILLS